MAGGPPWHIHPVSLFDRPASTDGTFDLCAADPPYNQGIDYGRGYCDRVTPEDYLDFTRRWMKRGAEALRPGGSLWVLISDEWAAEVGWIACRELGLVRRNWIKWHETFGNQTKKKFARCSRHLFYFVKPGGPLTFNARTVLVPSARQTKYNDARAATGGKVPDDVWQFSRVAGTFGERAEGFPTQIPEALWERVVRVATDPGGSVLEFFAGSGSLARVCVRLGRGYRGYERNERYAAMAAARVRQVAIVSANPPVAEISRNSEKKKIRAKSRTVRT